MKVFEVNADRYDRWYEENRELYEKELSTIPHPKRPSLEVGVGTGRFAIIGIDVGVDISKAMLKIAKNRGVECVLGDAKFLPFKDRSFESVYLIFTLCFLENPIKALFESKRVLKEDGYVVACIIPKDSGLGEEYAGKESPFYKIARFYTENEVEEMLKTAGFKIVDVKKTRLRYSPNDFVCFTAAKDRNNIV